MKIVLEFPKYSEQMYFEYILIYLWILPDFILEIKEQNKIPLLYIVGNNKDKDDIDRKVIYKEASSYSLEIGAYFTETSASSRKGDSKCFLKLRKICFNPEILYLRICLFFK